MSKQLVVGCPCEIRESRHNEKALTTGGGWSNLRVGVGVGVGGGWYGGDDSALVLPPVSHAGESWSGRMHGDIAQDHGETVLPTVPSHVDLADLGRLESKGLPVYVV